MAESLIEWLSARLDEDEGTAHIALASGVDGRHDAERWFVANAEVFGDDGSDAGIPVARARHADPGVLDHIASWDPARVLAEVAAKRRILALHDHQAATVPSREVRPRQPQQDLGCIICADWDGLTAAEGWCETVRLLALPYAGRDGWREEWRPQ